MERKLRGTEFRGGSAALFILGIEGLIASRRKRCDPNSDESRFPYSAHVKAHVLSSCNYQVLRAFKAGFYSTKKWILLDKSTGFL
jgi:hypothetical protein